MRAPCRHEVYHVPVALSSDLDRFHCGTQGTVQLSTRFPVALDDAEP